MIKTHKYGYASNAWARDVITMLGYPSGRAPIAGHPRTVIQGVTVWINPLPAHSGARTSRGTMVRRMGSRLFAQCPHCTRELTYKCLAQHARHCRATPAYAVIVGNIGTVYTGADSAMADDIYAEYVRATRNPRARCAGEFVTLMHAGEPVRSVRAVDA